MKIVLERLGSPYLSRRIVKIIYENVIPTKVEEYSLKDLLRIGAGVQSIRDTTREMRIYTENDMLVIETPSYKVSFGHTDLVCLEPEEELRGYWEFNVLRKIAGFTAALGFIAAVYDDVRDVVKKECKSVSSEVA